MVFVSEGAPSIIITYSKALQIHNVWWISMQGSPSSSRCAGCPMYSITCPKESQVAESSEAFFASIASRNSLAGQDKYLQCPVLLGQRLNTMRDTTSLSCPNSAFRAFQARSKKDWTICLLLGKHSASWTSSQRTVPKDIFIITACAGWLDLELAWRATVPCCPRRCSLPLK